MWRPLRKLWQFDAERNNINGLYIKYDPFFIKTGF